MSTCVGSCFLVWLTPQWKSIFLSKQPRFEIILWSLSHYILLHFVFLFSSATPFPFLFSLLKFWHAWHAWLPSRKAVTKVHPVKISNCLFDPSLSFFFEKINIGKIPVNEQLNNSLESSYCLFNFTTKTSNDIIAEDGRWKVI